MWRVSLDQRVNLGKPRFYCLAKPTLSEMLKCCPSGGLYTTYKADYCHDVTAIRERYHEEQLWSDKIRRLSTYGTLVVMVSVFWSLWKIELGFRIL